MRTSRTNFLTRRFGPRPKLFISYRRRFDHASARLVKQGLTRVFGPGAVFRDVDDLVPGEAFPETIRGAVESADVLLAIISPAWLESAPSLRGPKDFVRMEIAAALSRGVRVIPVLVGGARMPTAEELPEEISDLATRHAFEVSDERWDYDMDCLADAVRDAARGRGPSPSGARRRTLAAAAVLLAALLAATAFLYSKLKPDDTVNGTAGGPPEVSYDACLRLLSFTEPKTVSVPLYVQNSPVLRADEYGVVRRPGGVLLLLRLRDAGRELGVIFPDAGRDLGAVLLRYDGTLFRVEWVVEPPCNPVEDYVNRDRLQGDKHILQNWDRLRLRLGGRYYILRPDDSGSYVTATLSPVGEDPTPQR